MFDEKRDFIAYLKENQTEYNQLIVTFYNELKPQIDATH
jgi:hypothetical protein